MRAVVTGGAGFIGSHLCETLLARGWEVICLDNFITGSYANLAHLRHLPAFHLLEHDVTKFIELDGSVDYVLHFASPASPHDFARLPIQILKVGALGTHNTLGLAKAKKAKYLLASSSACYGDPSVHPQPESYCGAVNSIGLRGVYDESKRFAEALTMAYHRIHQLDTRIARIFNTYGPRMRHDDGRAIPNFMVQALTKADITIYGDGSQTRSFCYISDLIDGLLRLMDSDEHAPVNLGNPSEVSILELAEKVRQVTGSASRVVFRPLPEGDPKRRCPDISKARQVLGWEPQVSLEEGLQRTLEYFRSTLPAR